ncbi:nucleotidyltransferase family protein [Mucilaginibacter terrae]|uniref:nucleotidyltransferase family protein n=1 Tax=Mucilaginibacter terrae TaxID=1955052 RepID=UPI00362C678A
MLTNVEVENKLRHIKPDIVDRFKVSRIGYFGSYAKGVQNNDSDLDIIVEFSQPVGWSFFTLEKYLEQTLGIKVDLVTEGALKERIKDSILNQVKYI